MLKADQASFARVDPFAAACQVDHKAITLAFQVILAQVIASLVAVVACLAAQVVPSKATTATGLAPVVIPCQVADPEGTGCFTYSYFNYSGRIL